MMTHPCSFTGNPGEALGKHLLFVYYWLRLAYICLARILGLYGSPLLFGSRVALNPGLGGMRDVASVIISHEQTHSN